MKKSTKDTIAGWIYLAPFVLLLVVTLVIIAIAEPRIFIIVCGAVCIGGISGVGLKKMDDARINRLKGN